MRAVGPSPLHLCAICPAWKGSPSKGQFLINAWGDVHGAKSGAGEGAWPMKGRGFANEHC